VEHNNQFGQKFSIDDATIPVPVGKTSYCKS
jgi:hypothetical protein